MKINGLVGEIHGEQRDIPSDAHGFSIIHNHGFLLPVQILFEPTPWLCSRGTHLFAMATSDRPRRQPYLI